MIKELMYATELLISPTTPDATRADKIRLKFELTEENTMVHMLYSGVKEMIQEEYTDGIKKGMFKSLVDVAAMSPSVSAKTYRDVYTTVEFYGDMYSCIEDFLYGLLDWDKDDIKILEGLLKKMLKYSNATILNSYVVYAVENKDNSYDVLERVESVLIILEAISKEFALTKARINEVLPLLSVEFVDMDNPVRKMMAETARILKLVESGVVLDRIDTAEILAEAQIEITRGGSRV